MMRYIKFAFAVLALNGSLSSAQVAVAIPSVQGGAALANTPVLERKIDLELSSVPVAAAIDEIARLADTKITYAERLVASAPRVSVSGKGLKVSDALTRVLAGTDLSARVVGGRITVVERQGNQKVQGTITGKVNDAKTGRGISGATVSVDNAIRGAISDETGGYRIGGISTGTHTVTVRLVGYAKQAKSVSVGDGAIIAVDFKLEPSASVLNEVVVTGTIISTELKAVPSAITVITAKQIEERGITRIDQLFRGDIPGLFFMELGGGPNPTTGAASLDEVVMFSRGATKLSTSTTDIPSITNPIKTYVDGIELANPQYLSQIDPKSIERIEILTGPQASTIYGANAINGVMQIFTKRGNNARPSITFSLSEGFAQNNFSSGLASSHQYDVSASGVEGKVSYNVGSSWDYVGAWSPGKQVQRTSVYGGSRYQSPMFSLDLSARQGWTRNKQEGAVGQVRTALSQEGIFVRFSGLVSPAKLSLSGHTLGMTLGFTPFSWWLHQLTLGSDASDTQTIGSVAGFGAPSDTTFTNSQTPNSRVSQSYSSTLRIPIGSFVQSTFTYGGDHWRNRSGASVNWDIRPSGELVPSTIQRPKITTSKNSGAYMQGQLGLWDVLFLTYGIRADWNPNYGRLAKVRPGRYGASYSKEFGIISTKLRGSYGRSIRPPGVGLIQGSPVLPTSDPNALAFYGSSIYTTLPNPDLGPEFQEGGEGGIEMYIGNRGSIVVTRFNQTVDGLISQVSNVDSVRALQPGRPVSFISYCDATSTNPVFSPRSDGYCYYLQSQNLNVGSIRNQGWELQGSINTGPFTTHGTYSWVKSRVIGITQKYRLLLTNQAFNPGQTFNYVPEHTWAMNVAYASRGISVSLNVNGLGQSLRPGDQGNLLVPTSPSLRLRTQEAYSFASLSSIRLPQSGYTIANINASHRFSSKLEATLQITNLTNYYQNDNYDVYPTLGRQTRVGARLRW